MASIPPILPLRYLVVDDDQFTCDCICKLLERWGADRVKTINNGPDAINWLSNPANLPDIVICDLNMPEMDGIEFMQLLSRQKFTGDILLISGSVEMLSTFNNLVQAAGLNVLGSLPKPLKVDEMIPLIYQLETRLRAAEN